MECGTIQGMTKPDRDAMNPDEMRQAAASMLAVIEAIDTELKHKVSQLSHGMAILKCWRFGRGAEEFHGLQRNLLEESIDEDLGAIEIELDAVRDTPKPKKVPVRAHLPVDLRRATIPREPETTVCGCGCHMKRISEDVAEELDYVPATLQVEHHVRGKWVCETCETSVQAPVAPHVIDKGIPTAGLLAQVVIGRYSDHLPPYRQEEIYGRSGVPPDREIDDGRVGEFLADIVVNQPRGKEIHVIADNLSAQETGHVEEFLARYLQVHLHFTPTYSSWLNQVDLRFAKIERAVIDRGAFTSLADLRRKLMKYIRRYSEAPKAVTWRYFDPTRRITPGSAVTAQ
jgi:transposase